MLLVSYDLGAQNEEQRDAFFAVLKSRGWWHYLRSTWLVRTTDTPEQLVDKLHAHMGDNDKVLVIEVAPHYQGWLPKKAWDWVQTHFPLESDDDE